MNYKLTVLFMTCRAAYFEEALQSVLNQTFRDFKVIVSDNTENAIIINQFKLRCTDPRIYWVHAWPDTGGFSDTHWNYLRNYVDTPYFKYMFDDDILYPTSFQHLVSMLEINKKIVCAFHGRHVIDHSGAIINNRSWLISDSILIGKAQQLAEIIFKSISNVFGEQPFSMYSSSIVNDELFYNSLENWPLSYIADVPLILKLSRRGDIAISGALLGAFRVHGNQDSNTISRLSEKVEWELICRVLNNQYSFDRDSILNTCNGLIKLHNQACDDFDILKKFVHNLEKNISSGVFLPDEPFYELWVESRSRLKLPIIDIKEVIQQK